MSSLTCASLKPTFYRRHESKLTTRCRRTAIRSSVEPPVTDIIIKREEEPIPEYRFAEVLNGRSAMQGILWGSLNWMMTGENLIQQVEDPVYAIAATGVVTTLALASVITAENFDIESFGSFTPEAELKNGRLAMLGFTALLGLSAM
tara:strand:- start:1342 stop:1782 length:441 start_codon:yes stop_codon:yes gene_type:complete